jgi:hypothetical protein
MHKFALYGSQGTQIVFTFPRLFLEVCFQLRIALPCDEGGIEENGAQSMVSPLADKASAFNRCPALVHPAVETDIRYKLLRGGETANVTNGGDRGRCYSPIRTRTPAVRSSSHVGRNAGSYGRSLPG